MYLWSWQDHHVGNGFRKQGIFLQSTATCYKRPKIVTNKNSTSYRFHRPIDAIESSLYRCWTPAKIKLSSCLARMNPRPFADVDESPPRDCNSILLRVLPSKPTSDLEHPECNRAGEYLLVLVVGEKKYVVVRRVQTYN